MTFYDQEAEPDALASVFESFGSDVLSTGDAELPYVLVGGWAIAAFNQRLTTDIDVVIPVRATDQ